MISFPLGLRHALESGECVLFLGAGIGEHLSRPDGQTAPTSGRQLAGEIAKAYSIPEDQLDLPKVAEVLENRKGRDELYSFLRKRLSNLTPDTALQWIASRRWRAIYTTNYDNGIERAYELTATPVQRHFPIAISSELVRCDNRFEVPIYHLHGALFGSGDPHLIITTRDYARYKEHRAMLFDLLKTEFATSTLLYIGYSNADSNWNQLFTELEEEFYPTKLPYSYRVALDTNSVDRELLQARSIETIDGQYSDFVAAASLALTSGDVDPDRLRKVQSTIPSDLVPAFEKNPAAVARLTTSWIYVNQARFNDAPNIRAFLRGDRANWGLIAARRHFKRDIEDTIFDEDLLEYATDTSRKPVSIAVLGPAGYGVTTLLLALSSRLVHERVGPVFMLKPEATLLEGDVEYAVSLFPERPFFFIDNAADHVDALRSAVQRLRDTGRTAMFVLGERLNEWRQSRARFGLKNERELEPLSDVEIEALLDCLKMNGELGELEHLSRAMQAAVIKQKHGKELLVTLREATEDLSFDAILENEYRGIATDIARQAYLATCCFYQSGGYVRETLLAGLIGLNQADLHELTGRATEGVVVYECIDEASGLYAARARHRTIARVVWERCGSSTERERLLQLAVSNLNLNYQVDKEAFEFFIRSDLIVDSIHTLDGKLRFFENACKKEPDSPYVRQHYARMLLREGKLDLALGQIDAALELSPRAKILYNTRGLILSKLALTIESTEFARHRLVQSEQAFRRGIGIDERDEYNYEGLARLFLGWAKRASSDAEGAEYVGKGEEVINEGFRRSRAKDGLWIVSAEIQDWLGDRPSHLAALENAVRATPVSIVARYLLGRTYRNANRSTDALTILEPVIKNHPDEFRVFIEYALALLDSGKSSYAEAIAVLRVSETYGLSDARYLATLGGLLFMNGKGAAAKQCFEESFKRDFTIPERNTVEYRPTVPGARDQRIRLRGKIIVAKAGFALVESPGMDAFFCPGSKFGNLVMRVGLEVTFEPAFAARGPICERIFPADEA